MMLINDDIKWSSVIPVYLHNKKKINKIKSLSARLKGKEGRIRANLMGMRPPSYDQLNHYLLLLYHSYL